MNDRTPLEIERKFLIEMPAAAFLARGTRWQLVQTYLTPTASGENRRVRRAESLGEVVLTYTAKRRKSTCSCYEDESRINEEDYYKLLTEARPDSAPVEKMRYVIPHAGHLLEIDVYPFWQDHAVLEVELGEEGENFAIPDEIRVVREITEDGRYRNTNIARFLKSYPNKPLPIE